jgi:hypothetical protein
MASPQKLCREISAETQRISEIRRRVEQIAACPGSNVVCLPLPEGWGRIARNTVVERRLA